MASLSQGRTAAAQCGLFTYKSVPVIFEPPCILLHNINFIAKCYIPLSYYAFELRFIIRTLDILQIPSLEIVSLEFYVSLTFYILGKVKDSN